MHGVRVLNAKRFLSVSNSITNPLFRQKKTTNKRSTIKHDIVQFDNIKVQSTKYQYP